MIEYTLEASVKLGTIEYALVASVDPYGSLLAEGIAECHYKGLQPVTLPSSSSKCFAVLFFFFFFFLRRWPRLNLAESLDTSLRARYSS
jgi:hypothetical protein